VEKKTRLNVTSLVENDDKNENPNPTQGKSTINNIEIKWCSVL